MHPEVIFFSIRALEPLAKSVCVSGQLKLAITRHESKVGCKPTLVAHSQLARVYPKPLVEIAS
jgi:hypothetical protein